MRKVEMPLGILSWDVVNECWKLHQDNKNYDEIYSRGMWSLENKRFDSIEDKQKFLDDNKNNMNILFKDAEDEFLRLYDYSLKEPAVRYTADYLNSLNYPFMYVPTSESEQIRVGYYHHSEYGVVKLEFDIKKFKDVYVGDFNKLPETFGTFYTKTPTFRIDNDTDVGGDIEHDDEIYEFIMKEFKKHWNDNKI